MPRPDVLLRRRQVSFDLTTHRIGGLGQKLGQHHPSTLTSIMKYLINIYIYEMVKYVSSIGSSSNMVKYYNGIFMESLKHANLINVPSDLSDSV